MHLHVAVEPSLTTHLRVLERLSVSPPEEVRALHVVAAYKALASAAAAAGQSEPGVRERIRRFFSPSARSPCRYLLVPAEPADGAEGMGRAWVSSGDAVWATETAGEALSAALLRRTELSRWYKQHGLQVRARRSERSCSASFCFLRQAQTTFSAAMLISAVFYADR